MELHEQILAAAVRLSRTKGFRKITRTEVAAAARCAVGTVNYHFETMDALRAATMRYAVDNEVLEVVAQGLAENHLAAVKAPEALRRRAARELSRL